MADSTGDWPPPAAITTFADGDPAENGWVSDAPPVEAIEIAAYSPEWPVLFEASKELIAQALPGVALNIEHVGSTAVPNLAAIIGSLANVKQRALMPTIDAGDPDRDLCLRAVVDRQLLRCPKRTVLALNLPAVGAATLGEVLPLDFAGQPTERMRKVGAARPSRISLVHSSESGSRRPRLGDK